MWVQPWKFLKVGLIARLDACSLIQAVAQRPPGYHRFPPPLQPEESLGGLLVRVVRQQYQRHFELQC